MLDRAKYIVYGVALAIGVLLGAWFLNAVFERSWEAIALILLAMLVVTLIQRMIAGGIPKEPVQPMSPDDGTQQPGLRSETAHLPGIDHRYGWMALPATLTFLGVLISLLA